MTVWALISDVHGNLPALERAIDVCCSRGADRFAFLGDLLGRGDSDRCVNVIRSLADVSVVGNRDLDWRDRVGADARAYVLGLPTSQGADDFLAVHGDIHLERDLSTDDLRRGFRRSYARLASTGARLGVFGHSHRARVWRLSGPGTPPKLLYDGAVTPAGAIISVAAPDAATRFLVNVGTTGLPFPGKGPPSCAVYDSTMKRVEILPLYK